MHLDFATLSTIFHAVFSLFPLLQRPRRIHERMTPTIKPIIQQHFCYECNLLFSIVIGILSGALVGCLLSLAITNFFVWVPLGALIGLISGVIVYLIKSTSSNIYF